MSEILISAVIPAYNAEKFISACIDSVIGQTYSNWEAIIVDDGSVDDTLAIVTDYEKRDSRIKVIHQDNYGPGQARNVGIDYAKGDYVVFIDSDDVIDSDYFNILKDYSADVVFIDVDRVTSSGKLLAREYMSRYQKLSKNDFIRYQMTGKILWGGVRKAVKRDLLIRNNIRYSYNSVGEEAIYSFLLLYYSTSVAFLPKRVYKYINRPGSQSSLQIDDPLGNVAKQLKEELTKRNLYDEYGDTVNAFFITSALISLDRIAQNHDFKGYMLLAKKKRKDILSLIDSQKEIDYTHLSLKAKILYPFFLTGLVWPIYLASKINAMVR